MPSSDAHEHEFIWDGGGTALLNSERGPTLGWYTCKCGAQIGVIIDVPISGPDATAYGYVIEGKLLKSPCK